MLGSQFIPTRWRQSADPSKPASRYNKAVTPYLQVVTLKACTHPIRTILITALLGSVFYVSLLETGFFQPSPAAGRVDISALSAGSRKLHLGPETAWKWQLDENASAKPSAHLKHDGISLVTLAFLESTNNCPSAASVSEQKFSQKRSFAQLLPSSENILSPISSDTMLAFSVPTNATSQFLESVMEIPAASLAQPSAEDDGSDDEAEKKMWLMKTAKPSPASTGLVEWAQNSWTAFLDLIKNAETLDIVIMALGYLSMYLTFFSVFTSMRRMGSNFWLATTTLFSSSFALLFGLMVTLKLGVPENVVLLSEGVPFLVVTIGFEKPIMLTQAVLSASLEARNGKGNSQSGAPLPIPNAVQTAVKERGFEIVCDYAIEIAILCAGASSGIQGGLKQFCFLAAWTLFFDCILLFTFYTSILTIKLEINRIKRYVNHRKALEDDGISRKVAEKVASSDDWTNADGLSGSSTNSIFGRKLRDSSVPRFKLLMVTGFVLINVLNLCTMPFRGHRNNEPISTAGLSSVVTQPPMDPFKVAGNGLDALFTQAMDRQQPLTVTVLSPIKYELQYPSVHYAQPEEPSDWSVFDSDYRDWMWPVFGGRVVTSLLKSFEDPALGKWLMTLLAMSLALNGYLFNAARWTTHDSEQDRTSTQEPAKSSTNVYAVAPAPQPEIDEKRAAELDAMVKKEGLRTREECEALVLAKKAPLLTDHELVEMTLRNKIPGHALEKTLGDKTRAVKIRRSVISRMPGAAELTGKLESSKLPYMNFDYDRVYGACCENVVGYLPLPLGLAGPVTIDGRSYYLPMATTEGVLVASTSRGCKAINAGGGAITVLTADGMTRGPCIGFETLVRAAAAKVWLDSAEGQKVMKDAFNSTSRFARLQQLKTSIAGSYVYVRFKTTTGDAMGMNMISKGVEHALHVMSTEAGFSDMAIISVSGNYCTDKKPAAINWIDGRGKSVVAEAIIPGDVVRSVLKSNVDALVELNISKNLIGSAMAGSIGGFNAHAANNLTAMFLATGQDPAQNVESSQCITVMKNLDGNLQISVSMPCIEVGTIGGGTVLEPQAAMLDLLGVRGPHPTNPGANAQQLARIIAVGVLAGELSLCSALAAGHLVRAHMTHNRSQAPSTAPSRAPSPGPGKSPTSPVERTALTMTAMSSGERSSRR